MSREAMQQALDALELAGNSHGIMLLSDPPQDAWKTRRVDDVIKEAIAALRAALAEQPPCWCHKCNENKTVNGIPFSMTRMILCPDCGNKRCPHASDHRFACTVSNAPGQPGSVYGKAEQPAAQSLGVAERRELDNAVFKQPAAPVLTDAEIMQLTRANIWLNGSHEYCNYIHFARAILAAAIPPGHVVVPMEKLEMLRFVQRVLEGDAPQADKDAAAQMVRDLRKSLAARPGERG